MDDDDDVNDNDVDDDDNTVTVDPQDVNALRQIAFPAGSSVVHTPLQHASDFFAMYNVNGWQEVDTAQTFGDIVVNLNVWELSLPGECWSCGSVSWYDCAD